MSPDSVELVSEDPTRLRYVVRAGPDDNALKSLCQDAYVTQRFSKDDGGTYRFFCWLCRQPGCAHVAAVIDYRRQHGLAAGDE